MHIHSLEQWRHTHDFNLDTSEGERRTRLVVLLTAVMMVIEIAAGYLFGSMALLADGWHMYPRGRPSHLAVCLPLCQAA